MAKSYRFDPKTIEIEAGPDRHLDERRQLHAQIQVDGQEDHMVERGESVAIAFDKAGTYHYVCTLHSKDMDGEVVVK